MVAVVVVVVATAGDVDVVVVIVVAAAGDVDVVGLGVTRRYWHNEERKLHGNLF